MKSFLSILCIVILNFNVKSQSSINWTNVLNQITSNEHFKVINEISSGGMQITSQEFKSSNDYSASLESIKNAPEKPKEQIIIESSSSNIKLQITTCYFATILELKKTFIQTALTVTHSSGIDNRSKNNYFRSIYNVLINSVNFTITITETSVGQITLYEITISK